MEFKPRAYQKVKVVLVPTKYMDENYEEIRRDFQRLDNPDSEEGEFEHEFDIQTEPNIKVTVTGEKKDSDRWGENKYAIDARISMQVEESEHWEESQDITSNFTSKIKTILRESVEFTGPVILRSSEDKTKRSWARRLIKEYSD